MKTTRKTKPAPDTKDRMPGWEIGSDTQDIYTDAKVARALACLLMDVSKWALEDSEQIEAQQMQIQELAGSVFKWTEMVVEKVEKRLTVEAISAAAPAA